jgi:exosome complex exonuclease DIS3/RRP44
MVYISYCGTLDTQHTGQISYESRRMQCVLFYPIEKKIPKIRIKTRRIHSLTFQRIVVVVDGWDRNSKYEENMVFKIDIL